MLVALVSIIVFFISLNIILLSLIVICNDLFFSFRSLMVLFKVGIIKIVFLRLCFIVRNYDLILKKILL